MKKKIILFLAYIMCNIYFLYGESYKIKRISLEQGLSQSSVLSIFQDSRGFIWFGTENGLNKYDGHEFKVYKPEQVSNGFCVIQDIKEDKEGNLWINTYLDGVLNKLIL